MVVNAPRRVAADALVTAVQAPVVHRFDPSAGAFAYLS
jgi:hypothetical protein